MCSTEVGYGYGVLRANIRLKQRGVSAKTVKNDKSVGKRVQKRGKMPKKRGASGFLTRGKLLEEKILKSVSQNA